MKEFQVGRGRENAKMEIKKKKKYLVFGAGDLAHRNYKLFQKLCIADEIEILAFIDNDEKKWGDTIEGISIISPNKIAQYTYDGISIWTKYKDEINQQLVKELKVPVDKINNLMTFYLNRIYEKYGQSNDKEIQDMLNVMKERDEVQVFYFKEKIKWKPYEAHYDRDRDLYYILFEGKRVYIKRNVELNTIGERKFFRDIWYEQDINSPHLYEERDICVDYGDVILDVGACEGNFSIHNIDKIKKGYIIECDAGWVEALRYTFEPYQDKIEIIEAYVGEEDTDSTKRLDNLCKEKIDFLKMDIEGAEIAALRGARFLFENSENMKCAICAYHRHNDEIKIKEILQRYGMDTSVSKGYMLFIYDGEVRKNPELRRGMVRASKKLKGNYGKV